MIFVYDDTLTVPEDVVSALGISNFGNLLYKKKQLKKHLLERIQSLGIHRIVSIDHQADTRRLIDELQTTDSQHKVLYYPSNVFPTDFDKFDIFIKKIAYLDKDLIVSNTVGNPSLTMMTVKSFKNYWNQTRQGDISAQAFFDQHEHIVLPHEDYFVYLQNYQTVHGFLSNHYETRYFNMVSSDQYYVTKRSHDKQKMRREFNYYYLLPEELQIFFVKPFSFIEYEDSASYKMERLNIPDFSVQWIHHAVNQEEFSKFLDIAFYFLSHRPKKQISQEEFNRHHHEYYSKKLDNRLSDLEKMPCYAVLNQLIAISTPYKTVKEIAALYHKKLARMTRNKNHQLVISHGDFCFSNILYDKRTRLFKLIDPRGAMEEPELYLDPYYDVAKLSHSILGCYDFINHALYEMTCNDQLALQLRIYTNEQTHLQAMFKAKLEQFGFDYELVRLYEASLFLSMLPLHVDNLQKTFAFALTAANILGDS